MRNYRNGYGLRRKIRRSSRRGAALLLFVAVLLMTMIFAAFTVDIGFIALTKSELQKSADAAALSAIIDVKDSLGPGAEITQAAAETDARQTSVDVAAANRAGGLSSITADGNADVRFGNVVWNSTSGTWVKMWNVAPYNMVEVTLRRSSTAGSNNDGPLPLFFAPVINRNTQDLSAKAVAALLPAVGFRIQPGQPGNAEVLPIALDEQTWNNLMAGVGSDNYSWNPATKTVSSGADGILEVDLYPYGSTSLPPGNRGTVDFGSSNNSTADLSRQILYGLNASDLSYFGGEIRLDSGPLVVNGDTGISAGIKDELEAIKGQPRAIPIFSQVSGPGNNAMYTIVRFVGVRIMAVKLTGKNKYVIIQPAPLSSRHAIPGDEDISTGSIMTAPLLIE